MNTMRYNYLGLSQSRVDLEEKLAELNEQAFYAQIRVASLQTLTEQNHQYAVDELTKKVAKLELLHQGSN